MKVLSVPNVPWVPMALVLVLAGCNSDPRTWRDLQGHVAGLDTARQDVVIEKFVASKGGTPIVENQTQAHLSGQGPKRRHPACRRRLQRLGGHTAGLRRRGWQDDAHRRIQLVVPRKHVLHERPARVRLSLRQGIHRRPAESAHGPGVRGAAIGSAHAVLRGATRGR